MPERPHVEMHTELAIRFDYGVTIPWVSRRDSRTLTAVAGPHLLTLRTRCRCAGREHAQRWRSSNSLKKGESHALCRWPMVNPSAPVPMSIDAFRSPWKRLNAHWRKWTATFAMLKGKWRKAVMRSLLTLEGSFLRSHRRHRGGGHHLPAGKDRRHPQLGLPLLLAARRHFHPFGLSSTPATGKKPGKFGRSG